MENKTQKISCFSVKNKKLTSFINSLYSQIQEIDLPYTLANHEDDVLGGKLPLKEFVFNNLGENVKAFKKTDCVATDEIPRIKNSDLKEFENIPKILKFWNVDVETFNGDFSYYTKEFIYDLIIKNVDEFSPNGSYSFYFNKETGTILRIQINRNWEEIRYVNFFKGEFLMDLIITNRHRFRIIKDLPSEKKELLYVRTIVPATTVTAFYFENRWWTITPNGLLNGAFRGLRFEITEVSEILNPAFAYVLSIADARLHVVNYALTKKVKSFYHNISYKIGANEPIRYSLSASERELIKEKNINLKDHERIAIVLNGKNSFVKSSSYLTPDVLSKVSAFGFSYFEKDGMMSIYLTPLHKKLNVLNSLYKLKSYNDWKFSKRGVFWDVNKYIEDYLACLYAIKIMDVFLVVFPHYRDLAVLIDRAVQSMKYYNLASGEQEFVEWWYEDVVKGLNGETPSNRILSGDDCKKLKCDFDTLFDQNLEEGEYPNKELIKKYVGLMRSNRNDIQNSHKNKELAKFKLASHKKFNLNLRRLLFEGEDLNGMEAEYGNIKTVEDLCLKVSSDSQSFQNIDTYLNNLCFKDSKKASIPTMIKILARNSTKSTVEIIQDCMNIADLSVSKEDLVWNYVVDTYKTIARKTADQFPKGSDLYKMGRLVEFGFQRENTRSLKRRSKYLSVGRSYNAMGDEKKFKLLVKFITMSISDYPVDFKALKFNDVCIQTFKELKNIGEFYKEDDDPLVLLSNISECLKENGGKLIERINDFKVVDYKRKKYCERTLKSNKKYVHNCLKEVGYKRYETYVMDCGGRSCKYEHCKYYKAAQELKEIREAEKQKRDLKNSKTFVPLKKKKKKKIIVIKKSNNK